MKPSFFPTLVHEESRLRDERNVLLRDTTATNNLFNFTCGKNGHGSLQSCLRRNGFSNHVSLSAENVDYFISVIGGTITERAQNYFEYTQEHVKGKTKKWLIPVDYVNKTLCRVRTLPHISYAPLYLCMCINDWVRLRPALVALQK